MRFHLLRILLVLAASIAAFHMAAIAFSLYWTFVWIDVVTHFLGGAFVALFALWSVFFAGPVTLTRTRGIIVAGAAIFVVGIGWEVFEVLAGIPIEDNYVFDTTIDLLMDALGAAAGIVYVYMHADTA